MEQTAKSSYISAALMHMDDADAPIRRLYTNDKPITSMRIDRTIDHLLSAIFALRAAKVSNE